MSLLIIVFCAWGLSALARAAKEAKAERERDRLRREQAARSAELARMTAEWRQRQAEAKAETARLIALEREQMRQAREQEKLAKEQEKQAAQLAKHEKRIADLEFRMSQAESDIEFLNDRIAQLDAQRDYLLLQQSGTIPGGKEHTKYQAKIISIENQIHTAESKMAKAQYIKTSAAKELAA